MELIKLKLLWCKVLYRQNSYNLNNVWIILCRRLANERRRFIVTSSLIDLAHSQSDLCNGTSFTTLFYPMYVKVFAHSLLFLFCCGSWAFGTGCGLFTHIGPGPQFVVLVGLRGTWTTADKTRVHIPWTFWSLWSHDTMRRHISGSILVQVTASCWQKCLQKLNIF